MAIHKERSKRKSTGGRIKQSHKKKLHQLGRELIEVKIGEKRVRKIRCRGGTEKQRALVVKEANVLDPKTKKHTKSEILSVKENAANPHYVRRDIVTKGAVVETKAGLARVTSRPGQSGAVNAILISQEK